jgi:hypothetical protein
MATTPERGGRQQNPVRSALDSWSRTARLCLIYLAMGIPGAALAWLIIH